LKGKIEKNNNLYKRTNKKIINQNNEDQIGKHNTINFDWRMKLKMNTTLTKCLRKKIRNKKNEDQIEKKYNKLRWKDEIENK